jgi:hypothetical protein
MSRAQPKSSPTDEYAKKIAQAIAKGRPPPFSEAFDRYCESFPGEIFAAFTGAARHMPRAGKDEPLAVGYLFLLQRLLEHLRYRIDRGYDDAAKLIADFQADVVAQVDTGKVDGRMLALVGGALHQSKIPATPEFAAASAQHAVDRNEDAPLPADIRAALADIVEACDGDPFLAVGALTEGSHTLPSEARGALAGALAVEGGPKGRGAAVRRLIAMRNWRPENERAEVDAIIRKARAEGIDCAPWDKGSLESIVATAIDGAMAQAFLLISPAGRKKRLSSILTKAGIADAFSGEPETRRQIEMTLAAASRIACLSRSLRRAPAGAHHRKRRSAAIRSAPGRRDHRRRRLATRAHRLE